MHVFQRYPSNQLFCPVSSIYFPEMLNCLQCYLVAGMGREDRGGPYQLFLKVRSGRDWPRLSSNCLGNFESRGGLPDPDLDFSKSWGGLPDPDPSRPDFCRDFIPLEISCPYVSRRISSILI